MADFNMAADRVSSVVVDIAYVARRGLSIILWFTLHRISIEMD